MRTLVLSPPGGRRWGLESVLRNGGYDVDALDDPRAAGRAYAADDYGLVVIDEPDDGRKFAHLFLRAVSRKGGAHPPILCLAGLPEVVKVGLGADARLVHLVPTPVDGLILRLVLEDLGLPWGRAPKSRPPLTPPVPDRPWGRVGMRSGTVDAAGNAADAPGSAGGDDGATAE